MGYDPETIDEWTKELTEGLSLIIRGLKVAIVVLLILASGCVILGFFGLIPAQIVTNVLFLAGVAIFVAILMILSMAFEIKTYPIRLIRDPYGEYYDRDQKRYIGFPYWKHQRRVWLVTLILLIIGWIIFR